MIEDTPVDARMLIHSLEKRGHKSLHAQSTEVARRLVGKHTFDLAFVDLDLEEKKAGFKIISLLKKQGIFTVILSAHGSSDYIDKGYNLNCDNYLVKPYLDNKLDYILQEFHATDYKNNFREIIKEKFITQNKIIINQLKTIEENLNNEKSILISGPTGVGKTTIAKAIHAAQYGYNIPLVQLNCASISQEYIESELFGSIKGVFGRGKIMKGKLVEADSKILYLENIDALSSTMQDKVLSAMDKGFVIPVGGTNNEKIDCTFKLIASTRKHFSELRDNLYYKLMGVELHIPPLKDRYGDRKILVHNKINELKNMRAFIFNENAVKALTQYGWYGNLREMDNYFKSLINLDRPIITYSSLPDNIKKNINKMIKDKNCFLSDESIRLIEEVSFPVFKERLEQEAVRYFIKKFDYNKSHTGKILGMTYYTLSKYLKKIEKEAHG